MAPAATKKKEPTGDLMISTAEYKKTRDSVIASLHNLQAGLIHVQHGITDLLTNYRKHCASVLGGEEGEIPPFNDVATVAASVMEAGRNAIDETKQVVAPVDKSVDATKGKKRKREKKEKDPNAPKKPLTAAFLYHQHARPIVKADLEAALPPGGQIEKNAVQIEVNKRWNELPDEEKEQWKASYRNSMEEYKAELAEYIANKGIKAADVVDEDDASDDAEPDMEADVGAADSDASSEDEEEAPAKAPSPPAKTPRKRQKTTPAVNGTAPIAIAPAATNTTPVPLPNSRTTQAPAPAVTETPAKKDKKRKEKVAPQPIAPAPASSHEDEPTPEDTTTTKKKSKSSRSTRNNDADDKENAAQEKAEKEKAGKEKKRDRSKRKADSA